MPFTPKFVDLVRNYTTTTGTGDFVLGAVVTGYAGFTAALQVGESFYYSAIGVDKPAEREVGRGTLQANGTISRDPISGTKTNFTTGTKTLSLIAAAEWFNTIQTSPGASIAAASRNTLSAIANPAAGDIRHLGERGREGVFVFDSFNLSANVSADPQQGIYVAHAGDPTGASGAWVRRYSGPLDIRWFGAVADCTAVGMGTDNAAAINGAIAVAGLFKGGEILIPRNKLGYRVASTLTFTGGVKLVGQGFSQSPTGGMPQSHKGSMLVFDQNIAGLKFFAFTDNNADATVVEFESAVYSVVQDIFLYGGGGTTVTAHGLETRTALDMHNVAITNFAGEGLRIQANTSGAVPYGNANSSRFDRVRCISNGCHGVHIAQSVDANNLLFTNLVCQNNGGAGVLDESAIGGNIYIAPEFDGNNASNGAGTAQTTQVQADFAGLSDATVGSIIFKNGAASGCHTVVGAYVELGNGRKAYLPNVAIIGGILAQDNADVWASMAGVFPNVMDGQTGTIRIGKVKSNLSSAFIQLAGIGYFPVNNGFSAPPLNSGTINYDATNGMAIMGQGATNDVSLANSSAQMVMAVPTGTQNANFSGHLKSTSATAGVGYGAGAGGRVTQATSKSTGVTLNKVCGEITLNAAALAANTTVSFVLTNSAIAAGDLMILNHVSGGTAGAYVLNAQCSGGTASINVRNVTTGALAEAIVIGFAIQKAVTA